MKVSELIVALSNMPQDLDVTFALNVGRRYIAAELGDVSLAFCDQKSRVLLNEDHGNGQDGHKQVALFEIR